jgi:hypothetical protein
MIRKYLDHPWLGQQDRDPGIRQHEGQALRRIRRIQRHVAAPRLEDAEQSDDHLQRAF